MNISSFTILNNINSIKNLIECSNFTVLDIETTGLSPRYAKIIEIAAVKVKNYKFTETYSTLINPQVLIPQMITDITGIDNKMVNNAPLFNDVINEFLEFSNDSILVAHNAKFDVGFINHNLQLINKVLNLPVIDTLFLSRKLLKDIKSHKLNVIAQYFKIDLKNHHRALDDTIATAKIFIKFCEIINPQKAESTFKSPNSFEQIRFF